MTDDRLPPAELLQKAVGRGFRLTKKRHASSVVRVGPSHTGNPE